MNWLIDAPLRPIACTVKIRYRHTPVSAIVVGRDERYARVHFAEPQPAVTPGQAVVFYKGERVLGGGWIERALPQPDSSQQHAVPLAVE